MSLLVRWKSLAIASILLSVLPLGCSRRFFRERADEQVELILTEKNVFPQWKIENFHVYPDPRARFFDPANPDRPPRPPDDYAADLLSPNPQPPGKAGVGIYEGDAYLKILAAWDALNRARQEAESPDESDTGPGREPYGGAAASAPSDAGAEGAAPPPGGSARRAGDDVNSSPTAVNPVRPAAHLTAAQPPPRAGEEAPPDRGPREPGPSAPAEESREEELRELESDDRGSFERTLETRLRPFLITLEQASELALFNSREYQDRREDLYLSALPVTLERFAFAAQFFATEQLIRSTSGSLTPEGRTNRWTANTDVGFSKLFPTGALLLFRLANQLVIDLGRDGAEVGISTLSLELTQPLLRGGGFAVTLEALTQAERNLLYAIRSYARFRKIFYVAVAAGEGLGNPFGFAGLGVFGGGPTLSTAPQGYLPTLLLYSSVRIARENVEVLELLLRRYQFFQEIGEVSTAQVSQVEGQLLSGRNALLQAQQNLQSGLDQFKLQLGLPTSLPLELDTSPIRPIEEQLARFQRVIDDFREARLQADELIRVDIDAEKDRFRLREAVERLVAESGITRGTQFRENFPRRWGKYRRLGDAELAKLLKAYLDERDKLRKERSDILARREPVPEELDRRLEELGSEISIAELELALRGAERRPWVDLLKRGELGPYRAAGIAAGSPVWVELLIKELVAADRLRQALFRNVRVALVSVLTEPRAERLQQVRESWPELPPVIVAGADLLELDLDRAYDVSAQVALSNRLDLMNSRAQLVDAWRQIAVQANSLLGVLDVRYNLESRTPQGLNRPLDFSGSRTRHQLTFNGELPLVRRAERNNYRASLIAYQRQRRVLQATEDFILRDIRGELRQLRVLAETYRIQQRAVEVAYLSLETAFEEFDAPRTEQRFDVAGETQQLLNAQARLPQSQREIYAVWIDYLTARMQLYRDLELMPLDARGVWIDDLSRQDEAPADGDGPGDDGEPQRLPEPRPLDGPAPAGAQR